MKEGVPEEASRFRDHYYWLTLLVVNLVLGHIASRLYADDFALFRDAVSDLGATATRGGRPNRHSPYVFTAQMVASSGTMILFARHQIHRGFHHASGEVRLSELAGIGFLLMPAPHNEPVYHVVHMVGAGFVVFSLWASSMRYLRTTRRLGHVVWYWIGMTLLQGGVLTYALLFALDSPLKQTAQAYALISISFTIVTSTGLLAADEAAISEVEPVP